MRFLSLISVFFIGISYAFAAENDETHHEPTGHAAPTHVVGLFLGATDDDEGDNAHHHDQTDFTIGGEYEYRFSKHFGFGVVVEHTPEAHESDGVTVALGALHYHPFNRHDTFGGLRLSIGAGAEFVHDFGEEPLYRLGASYDFEITDKFAIAPTVNLDFVQNREILVFGLVLSTHL
jgi:hypothetical protein